MSARRDVPAGYVDVAVGRARAVALPALAEALREALAEGSLYAYAAHHPAARPLAGRGVAYAVPLPGGTADVVIRRSRHGGLLARVTGERFLGHTRAPRELEVALRLERAGVPTPEVVAYATYPAGGPFRTADVATRFVSGGRDLPAALFDAANDAGRRALLRETARLLALLAELGARHPDLNVKNVLITGEADGSRAMLLDVDRVWFDEPRSPRVAEANLRRFLRSARKWRDRFGLPMTEDDEAFLVAEIEKAT
jgi:hypothetical protein